MRKGISIVFVAMPFIYSLNGCTGSSSGRDAISTDSAVIARGQASFTRYCSGCHNFRQDDIGPALAGLTTRVSADWIKHFVRNPQRAIAAGDKEVRTLMIKYKVLMPSFDSLKDDELDAVIAFINQHQQPVRQSKEDLAAIRNPIPDTIAFSKLVVNLKPFLEIPASAHPAPLARITKLGYQPGTGDLFIVDLRGKLYKIKNNRPVVYLDMAKQRPKFISEPGLATGFGSFAFHPDFANNGLLYTTHAEAAASGKADFSFSDSIKVSMQWVLTEWKVSDPSADTLTGSSRELMRVNMVSFAHGMQEITFNPHARPGSGDYGLLYLGIGDGSSVQEGHPSIPHSKERVWGTILRIDPLGSNSANGHYGIPGNNPFAGEKGTKTLGEIYAYGFRNPQRISWTTSGDMIACNIGQANIESLNLIRPGHDYGWPIREGRFMFNAYGDLNKIYPLPADDSIYKITYPMAAYDHDEGNAISGGYEYEGSAIPQLKGKFLFGDIPSGKLFYINMSDVRQGKLATIRQWKISVDHKIQTLRNRCGSDRVDLHFGMDSHGELYVLTKADGRVYKMAGATLEP